MTIKDYVSKYDSENQFVVMINYYKQVLSKYAVFSGRATRAEYWWFYLANIIIYAVLYALGYVADAFLIIYYI